MSKNPVTQFTGLYEYILATTVRESPALKLLRETTATIEHAVMQISPDQGQFMAFLIRLTGAETVVEIGTFTGYSALAMAEALPQNGRLIACEVSREWINMGRPFWEQAGVSEKITVHIAPALETLDKLLEQGFSCSVDLIFIDADKANYLNYYEKALQLLKTNGVILVDNVFWGGAVADLAIVDEETLSIREFNSVVSRDDRVDTTMIAVGDGLMLARKR